MKTNEALFTILPVNGGMEPSNRDDLRAYLIEQEGIPQTMILKPAVRESEKQRLYAFIYGPLMNAAINGFTSAGFPHVDKVTARYLLEAQLCKAEVYNGKEVKIYIESISGMNKQRLLKFATDACLFLEHELKTKPPDSDEWFMRLKSGKNLNRIK